MNKVLIVEDNAGLREQMKWALADKWTVFEADSTASCLKEFDNKKPDVICLDMGLENIPDKGLEIIDLLLTKDNRAKIIVITANTNDRLGPQAIKKGAFDFFKKPVDIDNLRVVIDRAMRLATLEEPLSAAKESSLSSDSNLSIIGESAAVQKVFEYIKKLSQTDVNVLITGESGTGKELCARAIHYHSNRKNNNFVPINCGAIPENLIESELFGYVKGAFTGANNDKEGLIEFANHGTLLLDEIGEMPKNLQVKLLRFLEDQKVQRIGDTSFKKMDVRIIAATNRKTESENEQIGLRSDLYYRLSEFQINMPPLRERDSDVLMIAQNIIKKNSLKFNSPKLRLSSRAEQVLLHYGWPGNVRELENKLSRASITCANQIIEPKDLQLMESSCGNYTLKDARNLFEKEYIVNLLRRVSFNISEAAKIADVSRPTLYDMIKKLDIKIENDSRISGS